MIEPAVRNDATEYPESPFLGFSRKKRIRLAYGIILRLPGVELSQIMRVTSAARFRPSRRAAHTATAEIQMLIINV